MNYNYDLMQLAEWRLNQLTEKQAFQPPGGGGDPAAGGMPPPGGDPSAGGAPPMDPAAMGGMPPGMPPMDPSMMGGAPPTDPMGGAGGLNSDSIRQIIKDELMQSAASGGQAGGGAKPVKASLESVAMDCYQTKKLIMGLYNTMGMQLPPGILDGPNRDPNTGLPMAPGQPGSTSDPAAMAQQQAQQPPAPGGAPPGGGGAIPPIQPMEAAGPGAAPQEKQSDAFFMGEPHPSGIAGTVSQAAALAMLCKRIQHR